MIYLDYEESKKRFSKAYRDFKQFKIIEVAPDEHSPLETRVEYVKAYQELNNAYEALVTYNEYNEEYMEDNNNIQSKVNVIQESQGVYNTVKGSIQKEEPTDELNLEGIKFFTDYGVKKYDIDSAYIDRLLDSYAPNSKDIREDIEKALKKLNKSDVVKEIYRIILNDIDNKVINEEEDILVVKRLYFTQAYNKYIRNFALEWCVSEGELQTSAIQYEIGMSEEIPNIKGISDSRRFEEYKAVHPEAVPLSYFPKMRRAWGKMLDEIIIPLNDELK